MIWLRRAFTLPLILIFFVLLVAAVAITSVNNTAANQDFYNDQMVQADIYNYIYDSILPAALDEMDTTDTSDLPVSIEDLHIEIAAAVEQAFPAWWLQQQFESVTGVLVPYMVDDEAGFTYTFTVKEQMDDIGQAIKDTFLVGNTFAGLYDDLISYIAGYYYDNLPELPPDVDITQPEIRTALESSLSQQWLKAQLDVAIDQVVPYLSGDRNYFDINFAIQEQVSDDVLLDLLGPGNEAYLEDAREWIGDGWTYTQNDLYAELSAEDVQNLQDVRGWIHDGYTFDQDNMREAISDDPQELQDFDDARHWISVGRSLIWVLWLVPFLFLVGIGFLGGRGWKTRAAGPLVILFVVSLVMFLSVMLTWGQWGDDLTLQDFNLGTYVGTYEAHDGVGAVTENKANEIFHDAVGSLVGNMQNTCLYMMIASGAGIAAVGVWWLISSRSNKGAA